MAFQLDRIEADLLRPAPTQCRPPAFAGAADRGRDRERGLRTIEAGTMDEALILDAERPTSARWS